MIIYGSFTETSVAKLFMAGVVPGLLLTAFFMVYIGLRSVLRRRGAGADEATGGILLALADIVPFALLISGTMGSIYAGIATPTEAAAGGCFFSLLLCLIWGDLNRKTLMEALHRTVQIVGNLMFIIYAAYIYAYAIGVAGVGENVTGWLVGLNLTHIQFFLALFVLYTVLGCLVESIGMIVITVPLLYPGAGEIRHRPDLVRRDPGDVRGTRPDFAADRHQPVRDSEHLGRRAGRRGAGDDPVPPADVRAAGVAGAVPAARAVASGAYDVKP